MVNNLLEMKYAQILAEARAMRSSVEGPPYRITILSNLVLTPLTGVLQWALLSEGIRAEITVGEFDNIVQEAERLADADAVLVFWDAANLSTDLPALADLCDAQRLNELADAFASSLDRVLDGLSAVPLVLMNRFSALPFERDSLRPRGLGLIAQKLNKHLDARSDRNLLRVDMDKIYALTGLDEALDFRQFHSAKTFHTVAFLKRWVLHVLPALRAASGHARKLLAVDCDNTLWRGILGEDGDDGIQMDDLSPDGASFKEAQQIIRGWRREGILLAIVSKNNPDDVGHVLASHPSMQLRDEDFVAKKVGWGEKIVGLRELADELCLGLDSFVFLDDSAFELERVAEALPQVATLKVPEHIADYPAMLREARGLFFMLSQTDEDRTRTEMYRAEAARRTTEATHATLDDYLASLELKIAIEEGARVSLARAAQLTQKTNQFNLTTRRYTEGDIQRLIHDPNAIVATFSVSDRFGDYGVTAVTIAKIDRHAGVAHLDTFLMSCRVLGRKIETAIMNWLTARLRAEAICELKGEYVRTAKNEQVSDLLPRLGFTTDEGGAAPSQFSLDLRTHEAYPVPNIEVAA
jgi:FkbH-like protein